MLFCLLRLTREEYRYAGQNGPTFFKLWTGVSKSSRLAPIPEGQARRSPQHGCNDGAADPSVDDFEQRVDDGSSAGIHIFDPRVT